MKKLIVMMLVASCLIGCTTTTSSLDNLTKKSSKDLLTIVSYDPPLPAMLDVGQRLKITVNYTIDSVEHAQIWARPYTKGQRTRNYGAHGSKAHKKGNGKIIGWFRFLKPTTVDEVRVQMFDLRSNEMTSVSETIQAEWIDKK